MALEPTKHVNGRMWPPGVSGNPNGRPVFSHGFLKDLASFWPSVVVLRWRNGDRSAGRLLRYLCQTVFENPSLGIDISDAQLLDGWNSILVGEMPGISELLAKAAERASHCMLLPTPIANTSSTGQGSFQAFLAISKRSTCRQRLG